MNKIKLLCDFQQYLLNKHKIHYFWGKDLTRISEDFLKTNKVKTKMSGLKKAVISSATISSILGLGSGILYGIANNSFLQGFAFGLIITSIAFCIIFCVADLVTDV